MFSVTRAQRSALVAVAAPGLALVAALVPATTTDATAAPVVVQQMKPKPDTRDILTRVREVPGVAAVTEATAPAGYRYFRIQFTQPVDHRQPDGETFEQRITLLHKDAARPMVMYTSGYYVSQRPSRSEPTQIVDGNQISMEYRYFDPSRPATADWPRQLTIWQAATDQHRIIEAFKRIYDANWLTTGGSKGGMTATYHRRFYPHDVQGTVPYVAPNDVVDTDDVYNDFLDQVGTDQACRDALTAVQRRVLGPDREWFTARTDQEAAALGYTWDIVGGLEVGMEASIVDMYFAFWQYSLQADCASVPVAATATNEEIWSFFERVSPLTVYADQSVSYYAPYYYQAAYQLGAPEPYENRISDLLLHPGTDVALTFVPGELKPIDFDESAMPDVDSWVSEKSRQMLYVYGGNDPWSAEPFDCGRKAEKRECVRYYVDGGNHGSNIAKLPEVERARATEKVLQWAGLAPDDKASQKFAKTGEPTSVPALDKQPDYLNRPGL
ncbi:MAG: aminopeptidase [Nocardioides sp.]|nr:aminopeptidase [Nocardioides sp.]